MRVGSLESSFQTAGSRSRDSISERKYGDAPPGVQVDLRFAAILADLGLPILDQHDAFSDALMTAMMYVALADLKARNIRIPRQRAKPFTHFGGG